MKFYFLISGFVILLTGLWHSGCKSSKAPQLFCDTVCNQDTLRFIGNFPTRPAIMITFENCEPKKITRSYLGMGSTLTTDFGFSGVKVNKNYIRCLFNDTSAVYILFNDCVTGRGFQIKMPFNKSGVISKRASSLNNFDPKFNIAEDMVAYIDKGNVFVEEVTTGKKAMMTFGKMLDIDYNNIHETIDSAHITNRRIWMKIKIDNAWKELEKNITPE
ncbi:MAG: hypothetical protein N2747_02730 [Chitinophagaceae bacterium]|nr:hypothetical protein [Chitinophagaceae bacterium]